MNIENRHITAAMDAGAAFHQLAQAYSFCLQRMLRKYGLYPGQPEVLFALQENEAESGFRLTQNEIAKALGVTRASAGVSIRRLEKAGFVTRAVDPSDTRCNRVLLTKKGREFAHWCELDMQLIHTTLLEDFEGEERMRATQMLWRMERSLQGMRERMEQ